MKRNNPSPPSQERDELERQVESLRREVKQLRLEQDLLNKATGRHSIGLDPLIQAVLTNAKPGRHVGHLVAALGDLFDRFGLEFFGVSLLTQGTSYWASGLRLRGV